MNCVAPGLNCGYWFEDGLEPDGAVLLESLGVDREDRARRIQVAANDARARDDDFLDLVRLLGMRNATETQARADARGERRPLQTLEQSAVVAGGKRILGVKGLSARNH